MNVGGLLLLLVQAALDSCEKCIDFVCCDYVSARVVPEPAADKVAPLESKSIESKSPTVIVDCSHHRADAAATVNSLFFRAIALLFLPQTIKVCDASCGTSPQSVPVAIVPVASYPVETKRSSARLVESRVNIKSVPSASGAINDQVELLNRRNNVRMNICHRYATLAELCTVFGIEKQSSKKERQERKSKMTTNTKDRSLASIPSSKDISPPSRPSSYPSVRPSLTTTSADARYKPKLLHWGVCISN